MRKSTTVPRVALYALLVVGAIVTLFPIVVVMRTSLQLPRDIISGGLFFTPSMYNYVETFATYRFGRLMFNSFVAASGTTVVVLSVAALAGFSLGTFRWPKWWVTLVLSLLLMIQMLPPVVFAGPFYLISRQIGTYNTPLALIMAYLVLQSPLAVLILHRFALAIPRELLEAAHMDGARHDVVFSRICLPLMTPGLATAGLLSFVFSWNDFMFAVSLTSTPRAMTIPVGIANFVQDFQVLYGNISVAAAFAAIPGFLMVLFAQRYVTRGLTLGAIKE
jgi:multiple sugar transport system permease protein